MTFNGFTWVYSCSFKVRGEVCAANFAASKPSGSTARLEKTRMKKRHKGILDDKRQWLVIAIYHLVIVNITLLCPKCFKREQATDQQADTFYMCQRYVFLEELLLHCPAYNLCWLPSGPASPLLPQISKKKLLVATELRGPEIFQVCAAGCRSPIVHRDIKS